MLAKSVFMGEHPLTAEFRNGPRNPRSSYESWRERQPLPEGFPVDLQTNVLRFAPENYAYANRFARENPNVTILSTWRAASGMPKGTNDSGDPLGASTIEFPGHWVQSPGSILASNAAPVDTMLAVASAENMVKGPALLVEMDDAGDRLWERYEYVLIEDINDDTITVEREFNGSPAARSFPSEKTYVSPMPWDARNRIKYTDWFFNLSDYCPRDSEGRAAMDVLFEDMLYPLKIDGPLEYISGLDLASGPLTVGPDNADYDLDGVVDPESVYWDGVKTFYEKVRDVLGPNRILTTSLDFEFLGYINGLNREGLAGPNDPWRDVSRTDLISCSFVCTVNEVLAWQRLSPLPMASLAFQRQLDSEADMLRVQLQRLMNGYTACLGLAADIETGSGFEAIDAVKRIELFKGDEKEAHWLGKAMGMKRPAAMTPNLLLANASAPTGWGGILPALSVLRGELLVDEGELVLRATGKGSGDVTLDLNFELPHRSDVTVFMEILSDDDQITRKINKPRVSVPVETGPVRATFTSKGYLPLSFFIRGVEGGGSVTIDFRFRDGGDIRFRDLSVHAAPDALACEFERGVVLVNPSLQDAHFDLTTLFPGRGGFRRLQASKPEGADDVPEKYLGQLRQAIELNDGSPIQCPQQLYVPQRNALFLITDKPILLGKDSRDCDAASSNLSTNRFGDLLLSTFLVGFVSFGLLAA